MKTVFVVLSSCITATICQKLSLFYESMSIQNKEENTVVSPTTPHFPTDKGFLIIDEYHRYENDEKSVKMAICVCSIIPMNR
jgi:hypothetical protein